MVVDPSVESIRPYIVAFGVSGRTVDAAVLKDLIQTQEKLTANYGRKRRSVAMGIYRSDLISFPVHYRAVDPDAYRFTPLGLEEELSMREILTAHPTGREYGHIVADYDTFPLLVDDAGGVLSFPPVINSSRIGAVEEGDTALFIELTGTDFDSLLLSAAIVACDAADLGFTVEPARIEYPYDTPYGRELTVPYYFQTPQSVTVARVQTMLGMALDLPAIISALATMGVEASTDGGADEPTVVIRVPEYRNDILHPVDIVEDVMIGRGMESFEPTMPRDFTVGRRTPVEDLSRRLKETLVGMGYQEMIFNYLGSSADYIRRMYPEGEWDAALERAVSIANPMSENYELVRPSILPSLLSAEAVSAQAVYPHYIFEVGNTAERDAEDVSGTCTRSALGVLCADRDADFNLINSHVAAIMYYVGGEYTLREVRDARFIPGRVAEIVAAHGAVVGRFGELHPRVLDAWGVQVPVVAGELDVAVLVTGNGRGAKRT